MVNILVVEDDIKLNQIICSYLKESGYTTVSCLNPVEAFDSMAKVMFDLIISDVMMPEIDGFEFAAQVRRLDRQIPILFITALDDFYSKKKGYNAGIDDYMVKPVNMEELILRVNALMRRANIENKKRVELPSFILDADAYTACLKGEEIPVTVREFNILFKLLSYPNKTFSRAQLMDEFWELEKDTSLRAVDVYITKLRDKFSTCTDFKIQTVHGLGYKAVIP